MITFGLGVVASLAATVVYELVLYTRAVRAVDLTGYWLELMPSASGRNVSIGKISYDRFRRSWRFDGTNFCNDGIAYCKWESVSSYLDVSDRRFYYTFRGRMIDAAETTFFGFGVLTLENQGGKLRPTDGYYTTARVDSPTLTHSVERLDHDSAVELLEAKEVRLDAIQQRIETIRAD